MNMLPNELIAKQQLEIEELKTKIEIADQCRKEIYGVLYCIGGPLNDNVDRYKMQQLKPFFKIAQILGL